MRATKLIVRVRIAVKIKVNRSFLRFRLRFAMENTANSAPSLAIPLLPLISLKNNGRMPVAKSTTETETALATANQLRLTM